MTVSAVVFDPQAILGRVSLFADLSPDELRMLAHRTVTHHVPAGQQIFAEGDPCEGLFVVSEGEVKIFKMAASGREQVLTLHRQGDAFAELPVFDGGPYPASASAVSDSTLLFVSREDCRTICLEHPEIALKFLKTVAGRLRGLVMLVEELSFTTVRNRLISLVLRLARLTGEKSERGVEFPLTSQNDLASQIGTVRELVSRNLGRLQAEHLIRIDGKRLIIPDVDRLAAELDEV